MRRLCAVCAVAALVSAGASLAQDLGTRGVTIVGRSDRTEESVEVRLYRKMVAVVIGIDRYEDPLLNLSYAVKDAEGMEQVLRKQYVFDPVYKLLNEDATRDNILEMLQTRLPKETTADDAVLVFFSGHGETVATNAGPIGYLIPHDGARGKLQRNISMSVLRDDVSRLIPARHVFFIVDACYGGLLTTRGSVPDTSRSIEYLQAIAGQPARQVLTAGTAEQEVLDGGPLGYAVFTGRVVEALEDATDYLTANELAVTVRERVYRDAEARQHEQTPTHGYLSGDGDFVFVPRRRSLVDLESETSALEAQLAKLEQAQEEATAALEAAARERSLQQQADLQERIRRAKEAERLEKERIRREQEAAERARQEAGRRRREEQERLSAAAEAERLRRLVEEKRVQQESMRDGLTLADAAAQASSLRETLADVERTVRAEIEEEKKLVEPLRTVRMTPRGEFETQEAYEARLQRTVNANLAEQKRHQRELAGLDAALETRTDQARAGYEAVLEALVGREFPIDLQDGDLTIGAYDIDQQCFPIAVSLRAAGVNGIANGYLDLPVGAARAVRDAEQKGLVLAQGYGTLTDDGSGVDLSRLNIELAGGTKVYEVDLGLRINVTSTPPGAEVYVNDATRGETPLALRGLKAARDRVRVEAHGYRPYSVPLHPTAQVPSVQATLEACDWRELRTLSGHNGAVHAVALTSDGRHALTASLDRTATLWDIATGQPVRAFTGHARSVRSVASSPDGRYVLTGSYDGTAKLWEASSGLELRAFVGHAGGVTSVSFSADGRYALTGSDDRTAKLWLVASGGEACTFSGHTGAVTSVALSPDGRYALTGSHDGTAKLWDVPNGHLANTFSGHTGVVYAVGFSPDSRHALTGSWRAAKLWEVPAGRAIRTLAGHTSSVTSLAFRPDGRYVLTGSGDRRARLWELASGRQVSTFVGHIGAVRCVCFGPDGRYALTGSDDETAKLWVFE